MTYDDLQHARRVLGLDERASLKEIKSTYRRLAKRHHPDTSRTEELEAIRQLNEAYTVLMDYVTGYRFSFAEGEFYAQRLEERVWKQFEGLM